MFLTVGSFRIIFMFIFRELFTAKNNSLGNFGQSKKEMAVVVQ